MNIQSKEKLDKERIVTALGLIINEILKETSLLKSQCSSKFHTATVPSVNIKDYLKRIAKYAHCSDSIYIIVLVYVDRLQQRNESFILNEFCVHSVRLLITAVMVAAKFYDDFYYKNQYYAKVGGISQAQINLLEKEFIDMISFDCLVTPELFWSYHSKIMNYLAIKQ